MSITKKINTAVYTALNVSAVTDLAVNGVWNAIARDGTRPPFVTFNWQAHSENEYTFQFGQSFEEGLLLVKSYADEDSDPAKFPDDLNDEILDQCETLLNAVTISGGNEVLYIRRQSEIPTMREVLADRIIFGNGRLFRIVAT